VRLLHLSDLHIGKRVNEFPMLEDQRFVLEGILNRAKELDVDVVLIAGDLYDKSSPSAEAVALVDWFLEEAVRFGFVVCAAAGNHDSAERVAYANGLLANQGVHIAPVYDGTLSRIVLHDSYGPVNIWLVPFLKPSTVRPFFEDSEIESYTDALRLALSACQIDSSERNIAVSHQFVTSGCGSTDRSDSGISLGGMDNVDASVYDQFDYVALGHVHRPQQVGRREVRYSGSPLKYSISEIRDTKSAPLVELGPKGQVHIELVPIKPLRDLRTIKGTLSDLVDPAKLLDGDPNDYLYVLLEDEHQSLNTMDRLREVYPNVMGFDYDNQRSRGTVFHGMGADAEQFESQSTFDLFADFYAKQNSNELSDSQRELVAELLLEAGVM